MSSNVIEACFPVESQQICQTPRSHEAVFLGVIWCILVRRWHRRVETRERQLQICSMLVVLLRQLARRNDYRSCGCLKNVYRSCGWLTNVCRSCG